VLRADCLADLRALAIVQFCPSKRMSGAVPMQRAAPEGSGY
jgi:hypothetical protein